MKKLRIIFFATTGGLIGLSIHLLWHLFLRIELSSAGPHTINGTIFTLVGIIVGVIFYFLIPKK